MKRKGQKILIVDDEVELLKAFKWALENLEYSVDSVTSANEAIARCDSWEPDAILMDRSMPGMDGITCAEKIIGKNPQAKIILMSGYTEDGLHRIDNSAKECIKAYLIKPVDIGELSQLLDKLLNE
ncbi:MAG: response regulator [Desulfobacterales bacterium]|nr:response regulator [Desulfobacterales bacterium]